MLLDDYATTRNSLGRLGKSYISGFDNAFPDASIYNIFKRMEMDAIL
jgi:hypothetical protein